MWLEVEVGPRLFVPPEDDSYSVDFVMEVINRTYPCCTGMYLDRASHMLAFYGRKGSTRASLIQDVVIEAGQAVGELPMWMRYTARWRVRCVSLAEANEILTGCKRLEKENRRRERLQLQERLASLHQFSNLSANAIPFQWQAALLTPRPAGMTRGLPERGRDGASSDFSPPHRTSGSPLNRLPFLARYPPLQSPDDGGLTTDGSAADLTLTNRGKGVEVVKAAEVAKVRGVLGTLTGLLPPKEEGRRKMDFLAKSIFWSSVVRRATLVM